MSINHILKMQINVSILKALTTFKPFLLTDKVF